LIKIKTRYDPIAWVKPEVKELKVLVTGDWHALDKYGVNPPNIHSMEGTPISQSDLQKKVFKETKKICEEIGHVDIAILMGDMAEGKQVKSQGVPLNDANTDTQVEAAFKFYEETIHKYNTPDVVVAVMGTPYHSSVGIGGNLDYQIALRIGTITNVIYGYPNLTMYVGADKVKWSLRHKISIAKVNRMMPLEQIVRLQARDEAESFDGDLNNLPDISIFAHRHEPQIPVPIGQGRRWAAVSPPLKAADIYAETMQTPVKNTVGLMTITQYGLGDFRGSFKQINVEESTKKVDEITW